MIHFQWSIRRQSYYTCIKFLKTIASFPSFHEKGKRNKKKNCFRNTQTQISCGAPSLPSIKLDTLIRSLRSLETPIQRLNLCCVQQSERPRTFADWTISLTSFSIVQSANVRGRSLCWTQHWRPFHHAPW